MSEVEKTEWYKRIFDFMFQNHNVMLLNSEMDDLIDVCTAKEKEVRKPTAAQQVEQKDIVFRDGSAVSVSECFDGDTICIVLTNSAGTAKVRTEVHIRKKSAIALSHLIYTLHDDEKKAKALSDTQLIADLLEEKRKNAK